MRIFQTIATTYDLAEKQYPKVKAAFIYTSSWMGSSFTMFFEDTLPIVRWIVAMLTIIITLLGIYDWISKKIRAYKNKE